MNRTDKFKRKRRLQLVLSFSILFALVVASAIIFSPDGLSLPDGKSAENTFFEPDTPTALPSPAYTATPAPTPVPTPTPTPVPAPIMNVLEECLPSKYNLKWDVLNSGEALTTYKREYEISFPDFAQYADIPGITTFRGNNYRNSGSYGTADIKEEKLENTWSFKTSSIDKWTGVGWNGQPAIVQWDEKVRKLMNLYPDKKNKEGLIEVIYATLDGNIYFLDLDDGQPTRPPIDVGYPHKGSVAVDPRGYPLLYAGQGIGEKMVDGKMQTGPFEYRIFSLIDHKLLYSINGRDSHAYRRWGAFDSVGLVDKHTDTFIECAENGLLYTLKLNTQFDINKGTISIKPETVKYRYSPTVKGGQVGTENSPVVFRNYIYFIDNSGLLQCVDLNSLKPVWARSVTDDTDSTMTLEDNGGQDVFLYTACEVDMQGDGGYSYIRKINALSGELLWEVPVKAAYNTAVNGGALASPVIGKEDISNLVIFNIAKTGENKSLSKLIALDKISGETVWEVNMDFYCWSSPVAVYNKQGKSYIVQCDSRGYMRLYDGKTGKELHKTGLQANVEGSPAIFGNMIVVGTRGQLIWGVKLK